MQQNRNTLVSSNNLPVLVIFMACFTLPFWIYKSSLNRVLSPTCEQVKPVSLSFSWWQITSHLGLSVLQLSDGLSHFKSADSISQTFAHILYAAYLVMLLILLINMLIALLSNTYQRVQVCDRQFTCCLLSP